jgi:hypothetical protein
MNKARQTILKDKKGITGGLVQSLVFGVASLVIAVIIAFVIVSTINDADLLDGGETSFTVSNEATAWLNATGYRVRAAFSANESKNVNGSYVLVTVQNTTSGLTLTAANYTIDTNGRITNDSVEYHALTINYTYTQLSEEQIATNALAANLTAGVHNVSEQIPTVLLVAAVVLILAIMGVLVGVWKRMRLGGSGGI